MRKTKDGIIIYPHRGPAPTPPFGYVPVPGYPYQFKPVLDECKYRITREPGCRSCSKTPRTVCSYEIDGKEVGLAIPEVCLVCAGDPEGYYE